VFPTDLGSLDTCDTQTVQNANILRGNVYEALTRISPVDGTIQPNLAEVWHQVSDLVWEFKLRPNVKFHDGSPLDATAAAASINRSQPGFSVDGVEITCLNVDQFPEAVVAEAVDELTVRVTTQHPDPILPLRLNYADIGSLSTQQAGTKTQSPVGTGPYSFVERVQGEVVRLTRFDGYWGEIPEVKGVAYVFRAEPSVRAGMVVTGEANVAAAISVQDATEDGRTLTYKENRIAFLRPQSQKEPFIDPRVRQAVSLAIDRENIVPVLMGLTGSPWYQMLGPQVNGYIPDFDEEALAYDPERAKELIAAAKADGHAVETEFNLVTQPTLFPNSEEVVQAIAQNLEAVGLHPNILSVEGSVWQVYQRKPFPRIRRVASWWCRTTTSPATRASVSRNMCLAMVSPQLRATRKSMSFSLPPAKPQEPSELRCIRTLHAFCIPKRPASSALQNRHGSFS
jgi:peptide/nickel transport system substrate-binding protein